MLFGGTGVTRTTKLEAERKADEAKHRASKSLFKGGGTVDTGGALGASGNVPSILLLSPAAEARVKAQKAARAKEAEERAVAKKAAEDRARKAEETRKAEHARKAAAKAKADKAEADMIVRRAAFERSLKRVVTVKAAIPKGALTANARAVFALLVLRYADNGSRPVVLAAADAAFALDIKENVAREALDGLKRLGWVVEVTDAFGATKLMPAAHAVASVTVEEAA